MAHLANRCSKFIVKRYLKPAVEHNARQTMKIKFYLRNAIIISFAALYGCATNNFKDANIYDQDCIYLNSTPPTMPKEFCALANNENQTITPIVYKDSKTGIYFYVESDGRHVTAFSEGGNILWHRNPFLDANLVPYRVRKPVIVSIKSINSGSFRAQHVELPKEEMLLVTFNSSQSGLLDKKTGDFQFFAQN